MLILFAPRRSPITTSEDKQLMAWSVSDAVTFLNDPKRPPNIVPPWASALFRPDNDKIRQKAYLIFHTYLCQYSHDELRELSHVLPVFYI